MEKSKSLKKKPQKTERSAAATPSFFKLVIAYHGALYQGWQKQAKRNSAPTVQEEIEKALHKIFKGKKITLHGSGRTDSGVHARAQVAHLRVDSDLPPSTLLKAINAHLPDDIRVIQLEPCSEKFHAQMDVKAKTYRYFILNTESGKTPVHSPFLRPYAWFVTYKLDLEAMRAALKKLEGSHDFKSFQNVGTPLADTVREILSAELIEHGNSNRHEDLPWLPGPDHEAKLLEIRVRGSGFLKQMVRNIVGTIVEVGRSKISPSDIEKILSQKNRASSGMTAPPYGLFLDSVEY